MEYLNKFFLKSNLSISLTQNPTSKTQNYLGLGSCVSISASIFIQNAYVSSDVILNNMETEVAAAPSIITDGYYKKIFKSFGYSSLIIFISLFIGILGYHYFADLLWIDALLNASMILTGMGPVTPIYTVTGKLFASFYALFSGIAFLSTIAVFISPLLHRFMCKLQLDK